MRFHSTDESVSNHEITILALIECVIALAIYVCIGLITGNLIHFEFAIIFAPIFLLRTKYSFELGLRIWGKYFEWLAKNHTNFALISIFVSPLMGLLIRIFATAWGFIRHPLVAISTIPDNWLRQSFCTDLFFAPEIVPGESSAGLMLSYRSFMGELSYAISTSDDKDLKFFTILVAIFVTLLGYIPAIITRFSFKATFLCYLPLVFLTKSTIAAKSNLKIQLDDIVNGQLETFRRWLAYLISTLIILKLLLVYGWVNASIITDVLKSDRIAAEVISSGNWPAWQICLVADVILTALIAVIADKCLRRIKEGELKSPEIAHATISTLTFLRGAIATAVVLYGFVWVLLRLLHSTW